MFLKFFKSLRDCTVPVGVKERPDNQCDTLMSYLLLEGAWLPQDSLRVAEAATRDSFLSVAHSSMRYSRLTTYAHGNVTAEIAKAMHAAVSRNIGPPASVAELDAVQQEKGYGHIDKPSRARLLNAGEHVRVALPAFNGEDENSALVTYFQV